MVRENWKETEKEMSIMVKVEEHRFSGVFVVKDKERSSLSTKSLVLGQSFYGEKNRFTR